ncbi:MAG: class I mannose-6-phosphate isomerase [Prevotella sp.]|nr:class I mannose-6-phosphate isomerase [Prevotella sp.]
MKPFRFTPLLKQTLWGGHRIVPFKKLKSDLDNVGESWEISGVPGRETIVDGGLYHGKSLNELIAELKEKLVGEANYKRFGNEFPLLIKFIDAELPLSIQVHPTDEIAHKHGKERGKTEMWYMMESAPDASILVGLKKKITPEQYKAMVTNDTIVDAIGHYNVKEGDCFFLPAGRIHGIGKGCFLTEIQQTSDITYRIYDFKRRDKDGNYRQLHIHEAAESIDYTVESNCSVTYVPTKNQGVSLIQCPYFKTILYQVDEPLTIDLSSLDSFIITIITQGGGSFTDNEGNTELVQAGNTLLFPATTSQLKIEGCMKFLVTYI